MKAFVPGLWWRTLQEGVRQHDHLQYRAQRPAWSRWGWFWEHLVASGEQNLPFMPSMWVKLSWTHHFVTKNELFSGCHLASRQHQESRFSWRHTRHLTVCVWRVLLGACFWKTLYPKLDWLAARQSRVFMVGWLTVPLPCFCAMWMTCWLPVRLTRHFIECSKSFPSMWRSVRPEELLWGKDGGGSLKFLGRVISRRAGSPSLVMQVEPSYMDAACEEFGIKVPKGVVGPPDIKPNLEATSEESPISPEAHSRYRRVLGRLAWLAQTRMDLLHYTSLLASGQCQAEPKPGHEKALCQVLRFVVTDNHVGQHFPTEDRQTHLLMGSQVIVYTDASFAPMRVLQRRSISGAVLMYQAVTIKCFSRVQAAVSLSACEAELHAIQSGVQESIGLSRTLAFVLRSLNLREDLASVVDLEEGECPLNIQLRTDSLSGKQLLESYDLQRRSRHIEIRLCWLRRLLNSAILELTFCRGDTNLSDMFTKCVGQALYQSFRTVIGFLLNDLRLSLVISGSEKQKAVDNEEESESLTDLEGKPVGKTTKLTERVFQVFQLRDSFQRGRRCMLCDDVIEDDLLVEGEGEVFDRVSPSAAVVGSAAFPLSGVVLTVDAMASSSDKDEDRRSVREAREEAMAKEGVPDAKESKRKRRRHEKKKGKTPGEESKVEKPKEDEMEEVEVEEPPRSSKPPVRSPPVVPPKVKKDHLKDKVEKGKKGKGKGEKGKGKDKGKGKKGKGKAEVASPSKPKRPQEPPTPPPGHAAVEGSKSRNVLAGMGGSPAKPKLDLPGSGFTKSATHRLRCDFCRQRGHIARFCPAVDFRISLTDSSVRPHKREEKPPPQPEESEEEEDVAIHLKERLK